jgi:REP element-mobilizing transposase RayT
MAYLHRFFLLAKRYRVRVHAFCLMGNHVHFVLEPQRRWSISFLMRDLQSYHSRALHTRCGWDGHSWKHHFGAKRIETADYYRAVMWYVESNPVTAKRIDKAERYFYSSARAHVEKQDIVLEHRGMKVAVNLYWKRWEKEFSGLDWATFLQSPQGAADQARIEEVAAAARFQSTGNRDGANQRDGEKQGQPLWQRLSKQMSRLSERERRQIEKRLHVSAADGDLKRIL